MPQEPGRKARDRAVADLGNAAASAEQGQVPARLEAELGRLAAGQPLGDRHADVFPLVTSRLCGWWHGLSSIGVERPGGVSHDVDRGVVRHPEIAIDDDGAVPGVLHRKVLDNRRRGDPRRPEEGARRNLAPGGHHRPVGYGVN